MTDIAHTDALPPRPARPWLHLKGPGILAIAFGLLTLKSGGSVVLGDPEAVAAAGDYVPFVVWFNTLAGFAYIAAGGGLVAGQRWAARLAVGLAAATALVFLAFGAHIVAGGAYEVRTVAAMVLRFGVWAGIAALACRALGCRQGRR